MTSATPVEIENTGSGKTHRDENFPVASLLIAPHYRAPILAFYNFVRAADDISDHAELSPEQKLVLLDRLDSALMEQGPDEEPARLLRDELKARNLSPQHARELLVAFRRDVTKLRYDDWDDLIDYCRYSAMPVGRFVLDVHGEDPATTWTTNDALCAALQIVNHLQDCGKDYRNLNRVYLPQDTLTAFGATVEMLAEPKAPMALLAAVHGLAGRTVELLGEARPFAGQIADLRLAMEVGAIHTLADALARHLCTADPLRDKVHASKVEFAARSAQGSLLVLLARPFRRRPGIAA
jgi:squalene synthase HpnC